MTVGVGITTRNRPDILKIGLAHFKEYGWGDQVVVVDDNSDNAALTKSIVEDSGVPATFIYSKTRLGISNAKNSCLENLKEHSDVFLFDDDAWPRHHEWSSRWVDTNRNLGIGHSMFLVDVEQYASLSLAFKEQFKKTGEISKGPYKVISCSNCMGVMLYFTRECLDAIGGYDHTAKNVYGFEHAQMSQRAKNVGMTQGYAYLTVEDCSELIYSLDVSHNILKQKTGLNLEIPSNFVSSVNSEEMSKASENAILMEKFSNYIPLVNPLENEEVVVHQ